MRGIYSEFLIAFNYSILAYKIAFARSYPFLGKYFFNNPATPNLVYNSWLWMTKANVDNKNACCIIDTTNIQEGPEGTVATVYGFLEQNPTAGYSELYCAVINPLDDNCKNSSYAGPPGKWGCSSGAECPDLVNFQSSINWLNIIFQYVMPTAMLLLMVYNPFVRG